jgi:hypothetical protein
LRKNALAYLEEADDADPEVESDGSLYDGKSQQKENLHSTTKEPLETKK